MGDILQRLIAAAQTKRGGVTLLLALGAAAIGSGVVPHDGAEGQAAGAASGVVVVLGVAGLGKLIMDYLAKRNGTPPAPPAVLA